MCARGSSGDDDDKSASKSRMPDAKGCSVVLREPPSLLECRSN